MSDDGLEIEAGAFRLRIAPRVGGSIARFDRRDGEGGWVPVLRGCDAPESPLDAASFPLVPFSNRIRGGCFTFRGRVVAMQPNMAGDISPLHGTGWLAEWQVTEAQDQSARLSYLHEAGEWPWRFEAEQSLVLDKVGLSARLTCRNLDAEPMPCGLGFHPYFPCEPARRLSTEVKEVWTVDENVLPVERVAALGDYDLSDGVACGRGLDNGYGGWSGAARIYTPDDPVEVRLSSADAQFFQLYSPRSGGLFVAEPVSHANDVLSAPESQWSSLGMRVLEPGEAMTLTMRIDVIRLA